MADSPQLIGGRYALLRQLAVGGMAEVWLARQTGLEGFEKLVVVKRILPYHATNPDFVRMFLDEARTAADLRHSNVVSVTDIGADAGTYFIAMEYLHGQDLSHVVQRCAQRGERMPLAHALQVISDAAQGLHHAHTKVGLDGSAQQIVHRDVSPQNVFVTYDGTTKVLDFGIARAKRRGTRTDAGVVKGKYGYMSPEQLDGAELDARSDLFALAIVLWELVTLHRLFLKPSDAETLRAVMECKVPRPSTLQPDCPAELEDLLLKALEKDPARRFDSCAAFADALEQLLEKKRLSHSPSRVGAWLRGVFPEHTEPPTQAAAKPSMDDEPTRAGKPKGARPSAPVPLDRDTREMKPGALKEAASFLKEVQSFLGTGVKNAARKSNLVPLPGAYIGREKELAQLAAHFDAGARLVCVTGFGGLGKTRLSMRYAELHREDWAKGGGAWFVDLSDAKSRDDVVKAVARTLDIDGICETEEETVTQAGRTLRALGKALIILDNVEQVVEPGREAVGAWLEGAPQACFLVTSREPLRLPGEKVLPLEPLRAEGEDSEAVRLFLARVERGGVVPPSSPADLFVVAEICRRLDGLPLAIELAAARVGTLKLTDIRDRLDERFALLGGRGPAGRHATLWSAIDWSFQLLSEVERQAFTQLSVFRGGFTLEAAEGVLEVGEDAFGVVESLMRKSLLRAFTAPEAVGTLRLSMLESIGQFAAEKLEERGEVESTRARHANYFLGLGDAWAEEVHGHAAAERMVSLSVERENFLEVFERSLATMPPTAESRTRALRSLNALDALLSRKGPFSSHLALLDGAISVAADDGVDKAYLARALQQRANVQRHRGRLAEALEGTTAALFAVRQAGDRPLEGRILCDHAVACFVNGDLDEAQTHLEQSLEIAREVGDKSFEVRVLSMQGVVHVARQQLADALVCCDEALPLARERGDAVCEARVLGTVGTLYFEEGRTELAQAFFAEAVGRCQQVGEARLKGFFLGKQAQALAERGDLEEARVKLDTALVVLHEVGDLRHEGSFMAFSGYLEAQEGKPLDTARVTLSAAQSRLDAVKDPLLLTALALRKMHHEFLARSVSPMEARALLDDVRAPRGTRPARVHQSDEVRLAAKHLERALAGAV